jgi:hypothetical protein
MVSVPISRSVSAPATFTCEEALSAGSEKQAFKFTARKVSAKGKNRILNLVLIFPSVGGGETDRICFPVRQQEMRQWL